MPVKSKSVYPDQFCIDNSDGLHINNVLPPKMTIPSAGSDLYRTGLSLFQFGSNVKRERLCNPIAIFVVVSLSLIKLIATEVMVSDIKTSVLIGDWIRFCGAQHHMFASVVLFYGTGLLSQILHFQCYTTGKEPTYLEPFRMICGRVCPKAIGLTDVRDVKKLMRRSRLCLCLSNVVMKSALLVSIILCGVPLVINSSNVPFAILIIIVCTLVFYLCVHFTANFLVYQICYFQIICFYLKLKLNRINKRIREEIRQKQFKAQNIMAILRSLDLVHKQVKDFNDSYWSRYLFLLVVELMTTVNLWVLFIIFAKVVPLVLLVFCYVAFIFGSFLIFILRTSAMVSHEAGLSTDLLFKLLIHKCLDKRQVRLKIKVNKNQLKTLFETDFV